MQPRSHGTSQYSLLGFDRLVFQGDVGSFGIERMDDGVTVIEMEATGERA